MRNIRASRRNISRSGAGSCEGGRSEFRKKVQAATMLDRISQRLLTLLQFTRMALVFTAISNSLCTLLLATRRMVGPEGSVVEALHWQRVLLVALISIGLYGYGMALNDIIDRRRDRQLAAHRPIPSGRIALATAHFIAGFLFLLSLAAGFIYARKTMPTGWMS